MPRILSTLLVLLLLALGVHLPGAAHATQTVAYFVQQLKTSDGYRVRTQAALALGASGEDAAVQPLCDALGDSNVSVKVAAAAGLGKLGKPAALPCLKAAQTKETAPAVKTQLDKSIASLGQAGGGGSIAPSASPPPPPGPDTKSYIAIQVANKTMRSAAQIEAIVRAAMQDKLIAKKGYAVAPKPETPAQGGQIVKQSEDMLMKMCVENAIESFQKVVAAQ